MLSDERGKRSLALKALPNRISANSAAVSYSRAIIERSQIILYEFTNYSQVLDILLFVSFWTTDMPSLLKEREGILYRLLLLDKLANYFV